MSETSATASTSIADTIKQLISSPKLYLATLAAIIIAIASGMVTIKTNHLSVGKQVENEKYIATKRLAICDQFLEQEKKYFSNMLPDAPEMQMNLIFSELKREMAVRCFRNHINASNNYIYSLSRALINIVRMHAGDEYIWSVDFQEKMETDCRNLVEQLLLVS